MVESATRLHIAGDMRAKGLALGRDPIYDGPFHSFGIVSPCAARTLLYLQAIINNVT